MPLSISLGAPADHTTVMYAARWPILLASMVLTAKDLVLLGPRRLTQCSRWWRRCTFGSFPRSGAGLRVSHGVGRVSPGAVVDGGGWSRCLVGGPAARVFRRRRACSM